MWQTKGFDFVKTFFEKAVAGEHLSHAYLFSGQDMIGKRTFALELLRLINSSQAMNNYKNDQNRYDMMIYHSGDCFVVEASLSENSSITIDQIREANNFLALGPGNGPYKLLIIDNADRMTAEAQNAFLKNLEEPSNSSIIILVSSNPELLLPTIRSRCQILDFPHHNPQEIKATLIEEGVEIEKAEFLAEFCNGRMGLALRIVRDDLFARVKSDIKQLVDLLEMSLADRLKIAQKLADEDLMILRYRILFWILYFHMKLSRHNRELLTHLAELDHAIGQSQYNRRLMLENFMVKL